MNQSEEAISTLKAELAHVERLRWWHTGECSGLIWEPIDGRKIGEYLTGSFHPL